MKGSSVQQGTARFRSLALLAALLALAMAGSASAAAVQARPVAKELPALTDAADDSLTRALAAGDLTEAEYALDRALAVFEPGRVRRLYGDLGKPRPRDGTYILRDLAARLDELAPARRALAGRLLARPTSRRDAITHYRARARRSCTRTMCFFWVTKTSDAPRLADRNGNRIPDWVDRTKSVFRTVWNAEVGSFGYRRPKNDLSSRNHGPNGRLDIYVADTGDAGLYGYCTSDDPARRLRRSVSSYCVVDNDFSARQFSGSAVGARALKVTAAHEFFHAVQYGYDWLEDLWLMEGTATWIEDELYDSINDNLQYLDTSPLSARFFWFPLDYYNPDPTEVDAGFKYGAWIFWRYLSERFGRDVVRAVWGNADSNPGTPRLYSLAATAAALQARGASFADVYADFAVANFLPASSYTEGTRYIAPRPTRVFSVGPAGIARFRVPMFHVSNDYYSLVPAALPPTATLTITLDLPEPATAPRASALVFRPDRLERIPALLDPALGRWTITVPSFPTASRVVLVLTNGSTRFACWRRQVFSCHGQPLDDNVDFYFQATPS
jgi:hypothetical protein